MLSPCGPVGLAPGLRRRLVRLRLSWSHGTRRHRLGPAFDRGKLAQMDEAVVDAVENSNLPGGVLWLEHGTNSVPQGLRQPRGASPADER